MANTRRHLSLYAEHAGITIEAARKRLKRLDIDYLQPFDFDEADRLFMESRDPSRPTKSIWEDEDDDEPLDPAVKGNPKYIQSRAMREQYKANLTKVEYLRLIGQLIEAETVDREWARIARIVRDNLRNIGRRLGAQLAAESDPLKCEAMIEEEVDRVSQIIQERVQYEQEVA